jgi:hypothetical protein
LTRFRPVAPAGRRSLASGNQPIRAIFKAILILHPQQPVGLITNLSDLLESVH